MLRSILSLTTRHFLRNLYFSSLTLGSLVIGISVVILIGLWDRYEFSYDRQDPDAARVFVVLQNGEYDGEIETSEEFNVPLMDFLSRELPEAEAVTRIDNQEQQLTVGDTRIRKSGICADSAFFTVFQTRIVQGQADKPFPHHRAIAISTTLAELLFRDQQAMGKFISLDGKREFIVSAVYEAWPRNNSMNYIHFVLPYEAMPHAPDEWTSYYLKLRSAASAKAVEMKIDKKLAALKPAAKPSAMLFSLVDWRLRWHFENGEQSGGRIVYVTIFNVTAAFILLMACINYVNLATARASRRAREIGVRKVTGATQSLLVRQFLMESLVLSAAATVLSSLLVLLILPVVQAFTGLPLEWNWNDPVILGGLVTISVFTGLAAGIYPAFLLSSLRPAVVLKGNVYSALSGAGMRKVLVGFQFALSIGMIFVALMMWRQTNFLLKRDVGYDKHNVINVWLPTDVIRPQEALKTELLRHPSVKAAAFGGASPMEINGYTDVKWQGMPADPVYLYGVTVDFDMIPALGLKIVQGRNFSKDRPADSLNFIINKKAADLMGFKDPIGQQITYGMYGTHTGEIIGVMEDFHNDDIHFPIAPVAFVAGKSTQLFNLFIRYEEGQMQAAVDHLNKTFDRFYPGVTFTHSFLDEDFETQMHREIFLGKLSLTLTCIAIFIAVLGLLGLTLFSVERRTKEVGIRKVLGASVGQVMALFFREFVRPALLSFVIAFPVANYILQQYLEAFAYRIPITWMSFGAVALGALALIFVVVSVHTYRAAVTNPVESLKHE